MLARQIAIGFGIALIFPLLVYYGISSFYSAPKPENFYKTRITQTMTPEERAAATEKQRQEGEAYRTAARDFARVLVMVATPLGVAAILIGAYLAMHAIGTGLILGGILAVTCGYYYYWEYLDDHLRFLSLLVGFAILVYVGWRMLKTAVNQPS